jgi:outer membrane receptor protein involved in Fe transport
VYWVPAPRWAVSGEVRYDKFQYSADFDPQGFLTLEGTVVPLRVGYFHPSGLLAGVTYTFATQRGLFRDQSVPFFQTFRDSEDGASVIDLSVGFRLPGRRGIIRLDVRNLLDERFRYQEVDVISPRLAPERVALARGTFSFR